MSYTHNKLSANTIPLITIILFCFFCTNLLGQDIELSHQNSLFELEYAESTMWNERRDFCISGSYVYFAMINGLQILDVSTPAAPTLVAQVYRASRTNSVAITGNHVLLSPSGPGTEIFDISDPRKPLLVGSFNHKGRIHIEGSFAYVAHYGGIDIVDIQDLHSPRFVGSIELPIREWFNAPELDVQGNYLFVVGLNLWIIDISNPSTPIIISEFNTPYDAVDIHVVDTIAYIADLSTSLPATISALSLVNVSDVTTPALISSYKILGGEVLTVEVVDSLAYVTSGPSGAIILNVSDPLNITPANCIAPLGVALDLKRSNGLAFLNNGHAGILSSSFDPIGLCPQEDSIAANQQLPQVPADTGDFLIIDTESNSSPTIIGSFPHPGHAAHLATANGYAYVGDELGGVSIIDISKAVQLVMVARFELSGRIQGLSANENVLVVSNGDSTLFFDVSDVDSPSHLYAVATNGFAFGSAVQGTTAFLADGSGGLRSFNIADPANITELDQLSLPGTALSVLVSGAYAFVAGLYSGVNIVNISDPSDLRMVSKYPKDGSPLWVTNLAKQDNNLFIAGGSQVEMLDIADITNPTLLSTYNDPNIRDISVSNRYLYVAILDGGIAVIDYAHSDTLVEVGTYNTPGLATSVETYANELLVADYTSLIRLRHRLPTDAHDDSSDESILPRSIELNQNYPNPFNPSTIISFSLPERTRAKLSIYNVLGQEVAMLLDNVLSAGEHHIKWNGLNSSGITNASGIYFSVLNVEGRSETRKMLLLK